MYVGIAYSLSSLFASVFQQVESGELLWYEALNSTTMKIGRTSPDLDPKGKHI